MKNLIILFLFSASLATLAQDKWTNIITPGNINEIKEIEGKYYFATDGGLIIYDPTGKQIKRINVSDGLPSQMVEDIEVDSKGSIWIGTYDNGLAVLEYGILRKVPLINDEGEALNSKLYSIEFDNEDVLWVGTKRGSFKLINDTLRSISYPTQSWGSSHWDVLPILGWDIIKNQNGDMAFSGGSLLQELKRDSSRIMRIEALGGLIYSCSEYGLDGALYWGINGAGIVEIIGEEQKLHSNESIGVSYSNAPSDIKLLNNGELWVVFTKGEVVKFDGTNWELMFEIDPGWAQIGLVNDEVLLIGVRNKVYQVNIQKQEPKLLVDITNQFPVNDVRIAHNELRETYVLSQNRLFKFNSTNFQSEEIPPFTGKEDYEGLAFLKHTNNRIGFFERTTGTVYYENEVINVYNPDNLPANINSWLNQNFYYCLMDSKGEFWGSTQYGLLHYSNGSYVIYDQNNTLFTEGYDNTSMFYKIAEDNNGDIWVGHQNGLGHWNRASKSWTFDERVELGQIRNDIYIDEDNAIWLSSRYRFMKYKDGELTVISLYDDEDENTWIHDIHPYNGKLLLAGVDNFRIFDGTNFETYNTNNSGLSSNNCIQVEVDAKNNIWINHRYIVENSPGGISILTKDETTLSTNTLLNENSSFNINVFPNPANEFISIDFTQFHQSVNSIQLMDTYGKICFSKNISPKEDNLKIFTGDLADGVYILNINDGEQVKSNKIIIQ